MDLVQFLTVLGASLLSSGRRGSTQRPVHITMCRKQPFRLLFRAMAHSDQTKGIAMEGAPLDCWRTPPGVLDGAPLGVLDGAP